jgi:predicted secreted protein
MRFGDLGALAAARPWQLLALAFCILTSSAAAGDRALIDFIGYSRDERYLAIEEYGVNDGLETAFSNIYIVDLTNGDFAGGSPFRTEADEDEQQPLTEIREKTAKAAKAALSNLTIDSPVDIDVLVGDGELAARTEIRFGLPVYSTAPAATRGDYILSLKTFDLPQSATCEGSVGTARQGFILSFAGDGPIRELHRDPETGLPAWRQCPVGYRIYAVVTPHEGGLSGGAAIVASYPFGFEGPSRRFVVVPIGAGQ